MSLELRALPIAWLACQPLAAGAGAGPGAGPGAGAEAGAGADPLESSVVPPLPPPQAANTAREASQSAASLFEGGYRSVILGSVQTRNGTVWRSPRPQKIWP